MIVNYSISKEMSDSEFRHGIKELRPNNFSWEGLGALFEMLTSYAEETETNIRWDPIAFCCEFTEYSSLEEFQENYGKEEYPDMEAIRDQTIVHEFKGGFIIQDF